MAEPRKSASLPERAAAAASGGRRETDAPCPAEAAKDPKKTAELRGLGVYSVQLQQDPEFLLPYMLGHLINGVDKNFDGFLDFTAVWQRIGIERDSEGIFDGFNPSYSRWRSEFIAVNNPGVGRFVIVFISADGGADRRFVIFRQLKTEWQVVGKIDLLDNRYEGSRHEGYHRVITDGENTWLALRRLAASGTGVYQVDEAWYEISGSSPQKVLEYPTTGYFANDNEGVCNRVFCSRITDEKAGPPHRLQILFSVCYSEDQAEGPKLEKAGRATFVWARSPGRFVLDEPA
jgi:hypothetical protein